MARRTLALLLKERPCSGQDRCTEDLIARITRGLLDCVDGGDNPTNDLLHLHLSNGDDFDGHCTIGQIKLNIPCGSLALGF